MELSGSGYLTLQNYGRCWDRIRGSVFRWFVPSYTIPDAKNEASRFKLGGARER